MGRWSTEWENHGSETFCISPSRQGNTFQEPPPPFKVVETFFAPPSAQLKLIKVSRIKTSSKCVNPYSTAFTLAIQREETRNKQHEIYMANVKPTRNCPTQTIFHWPTLGLPLGIIGLRWASLARVRHYLLTLGIFSSCWALLAHVGARVGHYRLVLDIISLRWALLARVGRSRWVSKGFWIPTCWYRQREPLVLGAILNAFMETHYITVYPSFVHNY